MTQEEYNQAFIHTMEIVIRLFNPNSRYDFKYVYDHGPTWIQMLQFEGNSAKGVVMVNPQETCAYKIAEALTLTYKNMWGNLAAEIIEKSK